MSVYNNIEPAEDESHQAISSYFLGPKAENYEFFKKNILEILEGQRDARLDYFPRDGVRATWMNYPSICPSGADNGSRSIDMDLDIRDC